MSYLSITFTVLFYLATLILMIGLAFKIRQYWITPAPLKIPTTPAPLTQRGVVYRMAREIFIFESLFKANKWIWLFGVLFHFGMLLAVLRHLQYFTQDAWSWVIFIQPFGKYAAIAMLIGLSGLLLRRIVVDRIRYISSPSDYLMLILFIGITLTGTLMTVVGYVDVITLNDFFLGLMRFDPQNLPPNTPMLIAHLSLVIVLMLIFPFSKLLHAPAVFFSPTRNQADDSREKRHVAR